MKSLSVHLIGIAILCQQVFLSSALVPAARYPTIWENNQASILAAMPQSSPSSSGPSRGSSRGFPSKTARESAFNVEWEPMTELERRIEDGVHYEHTPRQAHTQTPTSQQPKSDFFEKSIPSCRGVFVGYRYTEEEYERLKSADPREK